ncbi:HNH endonuclease family protein [Anabaena sp. CCY 0017]|uniref:HNH endonuclease family protein n=1 Tax=Anabaena sp. CCY 0017 TaxID=3103866 RepID=UPI0039C626ED
MKLISVWLGKQLKLGMVAIYVTQIDTESLVMRLNESGNLTLTGHNTKLSDKSFLEKRDMKDGFADSLLRLNRTLAKLENWNEKEIHNRANVMAKLAVQVWSLPI